MPRERRDESEPRNMHTMKCGWCHRTLIGAIVVACLALTVCLAPLVLIVENDTTGDGGARVLPLRRPRYVHLRWIHSLERVLIEERYRVEGRMFVMEETTVDGHVPVPWLEEDFVRVGDCWVARWKDRTVDSIDVRIGTVAQQVIGVGAEQIPLASFGAAQDLLHVRVGSFLQSFLGMVGRAFNQSSRGYDRHREAR